jgi:glycosyltransferase involved in cell wall biosynthesis
MSRVSIIIPVFNAERTIERTLLSVLGQGYTSRELVVIDNLSADGTKQVLQKYREHINVLISEKDRGIYDAMNKGIAAASGDWLYFLGSDDVLRDDRVMEDVMKYSEEADVIYGNAYFINKKIVYDGEFDLQKLTHKNLCHQAIFFRKEVFRSKGNYSLHYKALADYEHNIKWFCDPAIRKKYVDRIIANYNDTGFSSNFVDEQFYLDRPKIFSKECAGKIDLSDHYHAVGNIAIDNTYHGKLMKGLRYSLIPAFRIGEWKYLRQSLEYIVHVWKKKLKGGEK